MQYYYYYDVCEANMAMAFIKTQHCKHKHVLVLPFATRRDLTYL